jgi:hypothetical protein
MSDFSVYGDWCRIDRLCGNDVKRGDVVQFEYDGKTETREIDVEYGSEVVCDHGHDYEMPDTRAYFVGPYGAKVYLRDLHRRGVEFTRRGDNRISMDATSGADGSSGRHPG